jgi:hypothetical protein
MVLNSNTRSAVVDVGAAKQESKMDLRVELDACLSARLVALPVTWVLSSTSPPITSCKRIFSEKGPRLLSAAPEQPLLSRMNLSSSWSYALSS